MIQEDLEVFCSIFENKETACIWNFYGDSVLANPYGEIEAHPGDSEELMIAEIDHKKVIEARRGWGFKEALNKRQ